MYDSDDIDILYSLQHHGWSTCILFVGDKIHSIDSISHVFGDPMGDLVSATISIIKGASEVEFIWWHEPGGTQWKIVRDRDRQHQIKIIVTEFSASYGELIKDETTVVEFEIKVSHFLTLVYYQMKKFQFCLKKKVLTKIVLVNSRMQNSINLNHCFFSNKAAKIAAEVRRGWAAKICSVVSPAANFSRINSTVMRVPATRGLPIITRGSETIDTVPSIN